MKLLSCTLALAAFLGGQADAWWDVGHGVTGQVARLSMKNPSAKANLDNVLTYMQSLFNDVNGGKNWPFIFPGKDQDVNVDQRPGQIISDMGNAAIFPDTVKGFYNLQWASDWHYVNLKYDPDNLGCTDVTDMADLDSQRNYGQMYLILVDMVNKQGQFRGIQTAHWLLHFHLAFITHLLGDMHMPFHSVGRCMMYDGKLTQDLGGNRWDFYYPKAGGGTTKTNQHSFWDSVGTEWGNTLQAKLINEDPTYAKFAAQLMQDPQFQPAKLAADYGWAIDFQGASPAAGNTGNAFKSNMKAWMEESRAIAAQAYSYTPTVGTTLTQLAFDTYQKWAAGVAKGRTMFAGYRMGALFDTIFSDNYLGAPVPRFQFPCGQLDLGTAIDASQCSGLPYHGTSPIPGYQQVGSTCTVKCKSGTLATATYTCTAQAGGSIWVGTPPTCTPAARCNAGVYGFIPAGGVRPAPVSLTYCPPKRVGTKVVYASKMAVLCSASLQVTFQCTY